MAKVIEDSESPRRSWLGTAIAMLVGLVGSIIIWVATPYNNFIVGGSFISDNYLPSAALFLVMILVLAVNPMLHWVWPKVAMTTRQLALAFGIMLVASCLPGQGLLRVLPSALAAAPTAARGDARLATAFAKMNLPPSLYPDKIAYGVSAPASEYFNQELPPGKPVPWSAWFGPLVSWGTLLVFCWMMMLGLSLIVLPQWRRNERLAFPLLNVHQSLIESPGDGHLFPPTFRLKSFWIAAGAVFFLHFLEGANIYYPEYVPAVPLQWDLSNLFSEVPWQFLPTHIRSGRVLFVFVGMAFFMPNRISFSIWFFMVAYAVYEMLGTAYAPPIYYRETVFDHRWATMLVMTGSILWIGRQHWAAVCRTLLRRPANDEDRHSRKNLVMFLLGCAGMYGWLIWVGVSAGWALVFVAFAFMVALLITRMVAETGMPLLRMDTGQILLVKLAPISWLGPVSMYFSFVMVLLFEVTSRVNFAAMSTHALALDETATAKRRWFTAKTFLAMMAIGLVVAGAVHLYAKYHHSTTYDGQPVQLSGWELGSANTAVVELTRGQRGGHSMHNEAGHLAFGAALAGTLQVGCLSSPSWPLHPVGILLVDTYAGKVAWASVFIGWLLKITLVRFGGGRLYRAAKPFFLGMILGSVFAEVFWAIVPALLAAMDLPYRVVLFTH